MKLRKGICLILSILLLTALMPHAAAVSGESVDGVWASIALTGGANKVLFSADDEIEQQILAPDEKTPAQYILPEGAAYDAASNTLTLTDFDGAVANLVLTMMGSDFKLRLAGSSTLASIRSESKGRGSSITICGDGALEIVSAETAILIRAGGAPDFLRVEPQARLTLQSASGSAIRVENTSLSSGAISYDTCAPELWTHDASAPLENRLTADGTQIDVFTRPGEDGLFGLEYCIDAGSESFVYNVYALGETDGEGRYAATLLEEGVQDISAYEKAYTPHDWTLTETNGGAPVSRVRFARFTVTASSSEGGTVSLSQSAVGRGGSVTVSVAPADGFKLVSLTVNGEAVSPVKGSYIIAGITSDKAVEAVFAETAAVKIDVEAPESTAFTVPADGAEPFVSEPFTAVVKDGAGDAVGATVLWSIEPQIDGVSIGADGRVTVASAAKSAAEDGLSFTVTAAAEGTELAEEGGSFTVSLAERRVFEVRLTRSGEPLGESDTVFIPAEGETTTQSYGAVVFDQYGSVREEALVWSAGDWPIGVRRDGDTLTVTDACREGSSLVVTAKCASDNTVAASVTVSFVNRPRKAPATRELPQISWPDFTLAENPVYGITWAELVTLGNNGSATLGGEALTGSFSINRDGAALPNVSDSFKIIFSYGEDDDAHTVEGEEKTVSLARKELTDAMITLSPAEAVYTGSAITPAVSVQDGTRFLIADTDFEVTGCSSNIEIGSGSVTVKGLGNYSGTASKSFLINAIPGSSVTCSVTPCKPEDAGTAPAVVLQYGEAALTEGTDYSLSLQYDIPARTGTATVSFKGHYSGTRVLSFDLPNYLITEGANSTWSKSTTVTLNFKANGALGKFTELTVDGKTVAANYYTAESGSTIIKIKADYLKSLTAGKHIVGIAYQDGKALAIFSVTEVNRRGVATGDHNNVLVWVAALAVGVIGVGLFGWAFLRSGRRKKKKKSGRKK